MNKKLWTVKVRVSDHLQCFFSMRRSRGGEGKILLCLQKSVLCFISFFLLLSVHFSSISILTVWKIEEKKHFLRFALNIYQNIIAFIFHFQACLYFFILVKRRRGEAICCRLLFISYHSSDCRHDCRWSAATFKTPEKERIENITFLFVNLSPSPSKKPKIFVILLWSKCNNF